AGRDALPTGAVPQADGRGTGDGPRARRRPGHAGVAGGPAVGGGYAAGVSVDPVKWRVTICKEQGMIDLPETLQQALDHNAGEPLQVVDPRTKQTYILLRTKVYEQLMEIFQNDLEGIDVGKLIAETMREYDENDPLLEGYQKYKKNT